MMMAAIATTKTRPTKKEMVRLPAPVTGGVRKPCKVCDTNFSSEEEEDLEISTLKEDIAIIWKENQDLAKKLRTMHEDEMKIKSMNKQMDDFITQIQMGKIVKDAASQTEEFEKANNKDPDEEIVKVKKEALVREKNLWKEKEVLLSQLLMFQKKSTEMKPKKQVKRKHWGHSTITWKAPGHQSRRDTPPGPNAFHKLKKSKHKPFFIPFQPKPIKSFTTRSHVKPPPRLPPAYPSMHMSTMARPVACNSVMFDEVSAPIEVAYDTTILREMFADALERAIASNDMDYSQEDCNNNEVVADIHHDYGDHDVALDETQEVAWADHPFYDDLGSSETDHGDEELDTPVHDDQQDEIISDDQQDEVIWEDHPYYDTSDEEDSHAESDVSEEDVAWEDSPYY